MQSPVFCFCVGWCQTVTAAVACVGDTYPERRQRCAVCVCCVRIATSALRAHPTKSHAHRQRSCNLMKPIALLTACLLAGASAFIAPAVPKASSWGRSTTMRAAEEGQATRQQQLSGLVKGLGVAGLGAAFLAGSAAPALAKEKVEYLTEPTPEFKAMQERAMEFEKAEFEKKKAFRSKVAALESAKTEPEIIKGLDDLTKFVLEQRGLPQGIKKQQLITDIRKVKKAGKDGQYWNKDAEISYEQLIYSINYQQSPNTARDLANPL